MIGSGSVSAASGSTLKLSIVFKLNYRSNSNISSSVVSGVIESLDLPKSPNYFDSISILGYDSRNYSYTHMPKVRDSSSTVKVPIELLGFESCASCNYLQSLLPGQYWLEHGRDCSPVNCVPFSNQYTLKYFANLEFGPKFLFWKWQGNVVPGLKYAYAKFDPLKSSCEHNYTSLGSEIYPDGNSIVDLRFDLSLRNVKGNVMLGNAISLAFGGKFFGTAYPQMALEKSLVEKNYNSSQSLWNVSYTIIYTSFNSTILQFNYRFK
ncbi:uncharacterized protein A4U43_C01F13490 [Asparagus officinalis]|uniref:DUF2921 domain-containing protein n=1 Tax=Asparagus officinalis TaxID=4686 RepID=A0A5P1FTR4_ASPOF|nr:uncharacterized protein A4U43_C01F13490 [Asparagus officinalis]